tara:strand:- start:1684 stop:2601 length:918 start_codon:yes stop_codon:yes gene_type:complete
MLLLKSKKSFFLHLFTFIFYHIQREVNMEIQHNSSVKAIIYMIDNCGMSPSDIENKTKISRTQVYRWRDGTVKKVRTSSLFSVAKALGFKIHHINNTITTTRNSADNTITMKGDKKKMANNHYELLVNFQQEKIISLKNKINALNMLLEKNQNIQSYTNTKNPIWEELDYDVMTNQVYETKNYAYFESYEIVRHRIFFKKLGYSKIEADIKYKEVKRFADASKEHQSADAISWLFIKNETDDNVLEWQSTKSFFMASKKKNTINALQMFKVTYKHKDGSSVPAIINTLYDFKGDSSSSKIKFISD